MANEEKYRAPVTYDGIGPFPMTQMDEDGFMMEWSKYRYPHRKYQDAEALSVAPLAWNGEIAFLNGVEGYEDLWPAKFMQMRRRCQLPRNGDLKHPLYGNVFGHFAKFTPQYRANTDLNGCRVQFTFDQVLDPSRAQLDIVENNPLAGAKSAAAIVDAAITQLAAAPPARKQLFPSTIADVAIVTASQVQHLLGGPPLPVAALPSFPSADILKIADKVPFSEIVRQFDEFLREGIATYDEIEAKGQEIKARFDELTQTPELLLPENADVLIAAYSGQAETQRAAIDAQEKAARLVTFILDRNMTPMELAVYLYEDGQRASQLMDLNPLDGTEYLAGRQIRFLDL